MNAKKLVEAALFMAGREIKREELVSLLNLSPSQIEQCIEQLAEDYSSSESCIKIVKIGDTYKMDPSSELLEHVKGVAPSSDLSRAMLKALSYIAHSEPVKQSEVVKVIGNRTYDYVRELVGKGFISSEKSGRTKLLTTTEKFDLYFGSKAREKIK